MTENVTWHEGSVTRSNRESVTGGEGLTVWLTGLSGSGKSTIAYGVEERLVADGRAAYVLDGDNLRHGINSDLGFTKGERSENVRRVGEVARLMSDAGVVVLVPLISPYRSDRDAVRQKHQDIGLKFLEVFVDTPLDVCEQRDPKGLYGKARSGELLGMTGVDDPYEKPLSAEVRVDTSLSELDDCVDIVMTLVRN